MAALAKAADTIDKTITRALNIVDVGTETAVNVANTTGKTTEGVASTVKHAVGIADETTGAINQATAAMHSYSERQAEATKTKTEAVKQAQPEVTDAQAKELVTKANTQIQITVEKGQTEVAKEERKTEVAKADTEVTRAKMLTAIENAKSKLEIEKKKANSEVVHAEFKLQNKMAKRESEMKQEQAKRESKMKQEQAKRDIKDANIEFDVKKHNMEMQNKHTEEEHKLNNEREAADRKLQLANSLSKQLHEAELLIQHQQNAAFVKRISAENEKINKCIDIGYGRKFSLGFLRVFTYKKLDGELPKTFYIATHLKKDGNIVKVTHKKNEHDVYAYYTEDGTMIDNLNDYTYHAGTTMQLLDLKPPSKGGKRKTRKPIRKTRRRKRSNTKKRRNYSHLLKH